MVGSIQPFSMGETDWNTYEEIMEQFFIVNGIEDEKKPAFLISCIGHESYKVCVCLSLSINLSIS